MGRWTCSKCNFSFNYGSTCDKCGADPPSSKQKEASLPIKQKRELSSKMSLKRGSSSKDKTEDKQQKKPNEQVQKQLPQLPPKGNRSKPSTAEDKPKVNQPQKKEATGEKQNTHNLWTFSNVVLFTGSASYFDKTDLPKLSDRLIKQMQYMQDNYIQNGWNYKDFMTLIEYKFPKTFSSNRNWKFILNITTPPFKEGKRTFELYVSKKAYPSGGQDCGKFVCSSSWAGSKEANYELPNKKSVANTSSYMLRADLRNWVESFDVGFPVFSVCDCNTFHTTGYIWGYYALKKASNFLKPLKLAVINFDQHEDTGGSGDVIGSDHWGNGVLKELEDLGHGGLYAVVGIGNKGDVCIFKSKEKKLDLGSLSEDNVKWKDFWNNGGKDINAAFVTIDRDCLQNHYTQWGDDSYFTDWVKLKEVMVDALQPLFDNGAHLIGVDITGLPENYCIWDNKYTKKRGRPDSSSVWADVDSQIDGIRAEFADQLEATASLNSGK